jgi:hypothetical protein
MSATLRARSVPYRPELKADERICTRCGILFRYNPTRSPHLTDCPDCRTIK